MHLALAVAIAVTTGAVGTAGMTTLAASDASVPGDSWAVTSARVPLPADVEDREARLLNLGDEESAATGGRRDRLPLDRCFPVEFHARTPPIDAPSAPATMSNRDPWRITVSLHHGTADRRRVERSVSGVLSAPPSTYRVATIGRFPSLQRLQRGSKGSPSVNLGPSCLVVASEHFTGFIKLDDAAGSVQQTMSLLQLPQATYNPEPQFLRFFASDWTVMLC
jgi:hypothetical protein